MKQNHDGLLSAHQVKGLWRSGGYHGLMFLIGTVLLIDPFRNDPRAWSTGAILLIVVVEVLYFLSFGWSTALIMADLWSGDVNSVEGIVWGESHWVGKGRSHVYIMDLHRFRVTGAAYAALVPGRPYRIFYAPRSKHLVSIEPLEEANGV